MDIRVRHRHTCATNLPTRSNIEITYLASILPTLNAHRLALLLLYIEEEQLSFPLLKFDLESTLSRRRVTRYLTLLGLSSFVEFSSRPSA